MNRWKDRWRGRGRERWREKSGETDIEGETNRKAGDRGRGGETNGDGKRKE